jgi:hypothetical protein
MRNATILYPAGNQLDLSQTPEEHLRAAGLDPNWTEWADRGPASINEALLRLATRGAQRVEAVCTTLSSHGELHLGTPRLRLLG